jgi:glycosyltransferase involved in cell wall biosynthesis
MIFEENVSEKIAVAQIIDTTEIGGAERVAIQLANEFAAAGFSSHLIVTRHLGELADGINAAVRLLVLNRHHTIDFGATRRAIEYIRKWNIRILHGHGWSSAYWCVFWKRLGNLSALTIYHDHEPLNPSLPRRASKFKEWLYRFILRLVNGVIGVSPLNIAHDMRLLSAYGMPIVYLPNGIDATIYERPNLSHNGRCILQVANLRPQKGHLHITTIARHLDHLLGEFQWLCVGDISNQAYYGQVRKSLSQNHFADKVFFLGKRSDVPELLAKATVGVLTSDAEGLPIALLEYMAAGLPVVVMDVGGCGGVVKDAGCGFVISQGKHTEFAEAIARLCLHPAEASAMGKRGQSAVREKYSAEAMTEQVGNFYAQIYGNFSFCS